MPVAAVPVTLTASERKILKMRMRGAKTPHRDRVRAQAVLEAARGRENERIAARRVLRVSAEFRRPSSKSFRKAPIKSASNCSSFNAEGAALNRLAANSNSNWKL